MSKVESKESKLKKPSSRRAKSKSSETKESKPKLTLEQKQELKLERQKLRQAAKPAVPANKDRFYCTNKDLMAELVKWRDSADKPEQRIVSEELGKMMMAIANKLLNHSNFRNYSKELKEDMASFAYYKTIKGLKNFNFKFNNAFSYFTQAFWNAYITVISRHYKQQNIKKDLMKKLSQELETYTGINSHSSIAKCLKAYLGNDVEVDR